VEEARRDAGVSDSDVDVIREVNDAMGKGDVGRIVGRIHPDIVWEHNIGGGTPEEGVYRGRDSLIALFERIIETWEYICPEPRSIELLSDGRYHVTGDLRVKHRISNAEIRAPYEQYLEIRDGTLVKAQMTSGEISFK
jgi:ketosteroid isomerase-like protein